MFWLRNNRVQMKYFPINFILQNLIMRSMCVFLFIFFYTIPFHWPILNLYGAMAYRQIDLHSYLIHQPNSIVSHPKNLSYGFRSFFLLFFNFVLFFLIVLLSLYLFILVLSFSCVIKRHDMTIQRTVYKRPIAFITLH